MSGSIATTYTSPSVAECRLVQWKPNILAPSAATIRSSGSNHGSAIRSASSAASMEPCSGWWAKAAALTRSSSASSPGRKLRTTRVGGREPEIAQLLDPGQRPAHHPELAHPLEAGTAGQGGRGRVVAVRPGLPGTLTPVQHVLEQPPTPSAPALGGGDDQVEQVAVDDREADALLQPHHELVGVVAQPAPGALVEGLDPVRRRARPGDRLDLAQLRLVHPESLGAEVRRRPDRSCRCNDPKGRTPPTPPRPADDGQASWGSRVRSEVSGAFSMVGITKR